MTPIWFNNLSIIYEKKYIFEVLPHKSFDLNRKLNSLLRLSIYYSCIIYLLDRTRLNIFYIPFIVSILSYVIHRKFKETHINNVENQLMNNEGEDLIYELKDNCRVPTKENPFMNPEIGDYNTPNDKLSSCTSYNNKGIQRVIEKEFNEDLYRDINDIFGKNNSQRQFYSVPGNTIPNDQGNFAKWLYQTPPTCKEGNGLQCAANQSGEHRGVGSKNP
jgi:hypothetical protein